MTNPQRIEGFPPELDKSKAGESEGTAPAVELRPDVDADAATAREQALPKKLSADEQMALYEKELKENDWSHQPC